MTSPISVLFRVGVLVVLTPRVFRSAVLVSLVVADLKALVRDYYAAAQIGAAMQDPTVDEEQDYNQRMRELMRRTQVLLKLGREEESSHGQASQAQ